jgi:hypothetical protein
MHDVSQAQRLPSYGLVTAISFSVWRIFCSAMPSAGGAAAVGLLLKTGSQLVCFSFSSDHSARSDSTQLNWFRNVRNFTTEKKLPIFQLS